MSTATAAAPEPAKPKLRVTEAAPIKPRFEILGYAEIPVDHIEPHPENPRPTWHLPDDNPQLIEMGDDIKTRGQTNPAKVYEIHEDGKPTGRYRLYQGERRWRACRIAGVSTLRCYIVPPPKDKAEELDWIGAEDAHKQDWQQYNTLYHAYRLAEELGVAMVSGEIHTRTSLSMADLRMGDKLFKLEPEIQALVVAYEEELYATRLNGGRRRKGKPRVVGSHVRISDFPSAKAAMVWDLFTALRDSLPVLVKDYSDSELQHVLAIKASKATLDDLGKLHGLIRQAGGDAPPGLVTELYELLTNAKRQVRDTNIGAGVMEKSKLNQFRQRSAALSKLAKQVVKNVNQIGSDPSELRQAATEALELLRDVGEMERELRRRIDDLERNRG